MSKTKGLLFTAGIVLAMAFTFSCSGDDEGGGGDSSSSGDGGGQGEVSSSSDGGGGNNTLEEVRIGSQIWSKKNLNIDVAGSKCYNNEPANCDTYGRLYDWETALTVCPDGWHLPTRAEWEVMTAEIGGESTEGKKLKAKSGWDDYEGVSGNGTDEFGFSALPGGFGYSGSGGGFNYVGSSGYWWSASEAGNNEAYSRNIDSAIEYAYWLNRLKGYLFSVRCVKD